MAISQLCEKLTTNMEKNLVTCSVFIDLSKAFDTVDHAILLSKLNSYGIRGLANNLFKNYLDQRLQVTVVNGVRSTIKKVTCGVPQGSILGPLLFLLYVNDLPNVSLFDVRLFADDACLLLSNKDSVMLQKICDNELIKIHNWMKINKLSINFEKTNFMIFSKKRKKVKFNLDIEGNILNRVSNIKYLGIMINECLNWSSHIQHVRTKISRACYIISKIRYYVDQKTLIMLYYSMVYSHLTYCISSWGGAAKTVLEPLNILQRRIIRLITFSDFQCHAPPLFLKLKLLTIENIYYYKLGILFHDIQHGKVTGEININSLNTIHSYNTRLSHNNNYFTTHSKTNLGLRTYISSGVKFWRKIPADLKALNLPRFKRDLKLFLLAVSK